MAFWWCWDLEKNPSSSSSTILPIKSRWRMCFMNYLGLLWNLFLIFQSKNKVSWIILGLCETCFWNSSLRTNSQLRIWFCRPFVLILRTHCICICIYICIYIYIQVVLGIRTIRYKNNPVHEQGLKGSKICS